VPWKFTPRAKRVLKLSLEARQLGHNYIGTEHLLLGLSQDGEGVAARVLENLGVDLRKCGVHLEKLRCYLILHRVALTPALDEFGSNLTGSGR